MKSPLGGDVFNKTKRSEVMACIRGHGNRTTELALIKLFRIHHITGWRRRQPVFGKPDFIFRRQKIAVFVDGCFWHGCPKHGRKPNSNRLYWNKKLKRNRARDAKVEKTITKMGWSVIRFWEHDLKNPDKCASTVRQALIRARNRLKSATN
jgi:DNA mismatch endonuclease (patch repair protein)